MSFAINLVPKNW